MIAAILAAAAFLRFFRLGHESLWLDEGYTYTNVIQPAYDVLTFRDVHPPAFPLLLHFWVKFFGVSEAGLRSLSAVLGVVTVFAVFRLAARLFDRRVGLYAAAFSALAVFHVHYSQEARPYALLTLLTALSFLLFSEILAKPSRRAHALHALVTVLALYTHLFAVFAWMAQNLFYLLRWLAAPARRLSDLFQWISVQGAVFVAYLPWLFIMTAQTKAAKGNFWIPAPTAWAPIELFREFSGGTALLGLMGLLALWGAVRLWAGRKAGERETLGLLAMWIAVVVGLPLVLSFAWQPVFIARYMIGASAAFYLLAAYGLAALRPTLLRVLAAAALFALMGNALVYYYTHPRNEQWRAVAAKITDEASPGDLVVVHSYKSREIFSYYFSRLDVEVLPFPKPSDELAPGLTSEKAHLVTDGHLDLLEEKAAAHSRVWAVISHTRDAEKRIDATLRRSHPREKEEQYLGIRLLRFEK